MGSQRETLHQQQLVLTVAELGCLLCICMCPRCVPGVCTQLLHCRCLGLQVAVAEAMAYTITAYANRTSWKVGKPAY
eukprot:scaffold243299_cov24-Tisochrysis_lutea.AAC.1